MQAEVVVLHITDLLQVVVTEILQEVQHHLMAQEAEVALLRTALQAQEVALHHTLLLLAPALQVLLAVEAEVDHRLAAVAEVAAKIVF